MVGTLVRRCRRAISLCDLEFTIDLTTVTLNFKIWCDLDLTFDLAVVTLTCETLFRVR